ncbi:hypothetical protein ABNN70_00425 [Sporolactobacillus sp. Y61]|uniref:Polymerase nucleotidyl transferase domain-containing protein n=1 Tax=Sporolactobacillus sp. Y61 TaxID=3160863 RepID=A0AAU8IFW1_9BACL
MNSRCHELMQLAMSFIASFYPSACCVSIGGSAARGTADQYSDLDLTVYNNSTQMCDQNIEFRHTLIQVQCSPIPRLEAVYQNPWAYRFLNEIKIIKDKNNLLSCVQSDAKKFLNSSAGQKKMIRTVQAIVQDRILATKRFFQAGRFYSATNAAMGAWSEAAFLNLFLKEGSLSTSRVIPCIRKDQDLYRAFRTHASIRDCDFMTDFSPILHRLREYLRAHHVKAPFDLDPLQEKLVERKNKRFIETGDSFNLQWQMYGEALWLFFCINDSISFEHVYDQLPERLQRELSWIGFTPLEKDNLDGLCSLSNNILSD